MKPGLPGPLRLFLWVLFALALLSLLDATYSSLHARSLRVGDLWIPYPGFDFYDYTPRFVFLHQQRFFTATDAFPWIYPAPAVFVLYPFYLLATPTRWHLGYALFATLGLALSGGAALRLASALQRRGLTRRQSFLLLGGVAGMGWPLYFALQRGNIELLLWIGVAGAVALIASGRNYRGAMLLGIVGSVKTYPLLLLGLLVLRRQFRACALALIFALLTTLLALRFLEPDVADAWSHIQTGIAQWTSITTSQYFVTGIGPDHSLLGLLRQCTRGAILRSPGALQRYVITVAIAFATVFFVRVRIMPMANQVLFLVCAAILLPPTSYDYTVLLLLVPWGWACLLCVEQGRTGRSPDRFYGLFLLFALALAPLTFLHTRGEPPVLFEGPARSVALLALTAWAALVPVSGEALGTAERS